MFRALSSTTRIRSRDAIAAATEMGASRYIALSRARLAHVLVALGREAEALVESRQRGMSSGRRRSGRPLVGASSRAAARRAMRSRSPARRSSRCQGRSIRSHAEVLVTGALVELEDAACPRTAPPWRPLGRASSPVAAGRAMRRGRPRGGRVDGGDGRHHGASQVLVEWPRYSGSTVTSWAPRRRWPRPSPSTSRRGISSPSSGAGGSSRSCRRAVRSRVGPDQVSRRPSSSGQALRPSASSSLAPTGTSRRT